MKSTSLHPALRAQDLVERTLGQARISEKRNIKLFLTGEYGSLELVLRVAQYTFIIDCSS